MRVYLVRHAAAVPESAPTKDSDRWLSASGREDAGKLGRMLGEESVRFERVFSSPLVRAVQTAELLCAALGHAGVVEARANLAPGCQPEVAAREIMALGADILVVGHEPAISALAALLVGQPSFESFRKGQVVLIDGGKPVWRMTPASSGAQPLV